MNEVLWVQEEEEQSDWTLFVALLVADTWLCNYRRQPVYSGKQRDVVSDATREQVLSDRGRRPTNRQLLNKPASFLLPPPKRSCVLA